MHRQRADPLVLVFSIRHLCSRPRRFATANAECVLAFLQVEAHAERDDAFLAYPHRRDDRPLLPRAGREDQVPQPVEQVKEVFFDTASLTSVNLLRVLLAERGLRPEFKPLAGYDFVALPDYSLLIGDPAIDFLRAPRQHDIWDLGAAWYEMTGLPFVYAVWALRRGVESARLRRQLREAKSFGLDTLDSIISSRNEYDYDFCKDYLGWHIHYHLGADEKRGLAKFIELLDRHGLGPLHEPKFVA